MTTKKRRNSKIWWKVCIVLTIFAIVFNIGLTSINSNSTPNQSPHTHISKSCNWVEMDNGLYGGMIITLVVDSKDNIYVETEDGIFKSEDEGKTWKQVHVGKFADIGRLLIVIDSNDVLYAGTYQSILKSTDGGKTWKQVLNNHYITCLAVSNSDNEWKTEKSR